ncbi:hypothetical protein BHU72_14465 [Desulfuribacillus stibiiarsenatis]|uniref:Uncharacterized protein n=1 Tax=Desulfuribacillus stibiiarsenatis TaxID=1390249 RepID=A0A1E5L795_9FIRM|nr:hypothetical protein [Desulfuribacillus stibiiarsenatis]OEH86032.1 hypothetical protein BHU72_14465 [Desulfuribacillus stibiiarsenatis]
MVFFKRFLLYIVGSLVTIVQFISGYFFSIIGSIINFLIGASIVVVISIGSLVVGAGLIFDISQKTDILIFIYHIIGIDNPNDSLSIELITKSSTFIGVIASISFTIYLFAFKEQKSFSVSSVNNISKHLVSLIFIVMCIVTIALGFFMENLMLQKNISIKNSSIETLLAKETKRKIEFLVSSNPGLSENDIKSEIEKRKMLIRENYVTLYYFIAYSIWSTFFLISIISTLVFLINIVNMLNLRWQFKQYIHLLNIELGILPLISKVKIFKPIRVYTYDSIHYYFECVYQMLLFCLNNNMYKLYKISSNKLFNIILSIYIEKKKRLYDNYTYAVLNNVDSEEFKLLNKAILRNQISLTLYHCDKYQIEEMTNCIDVIFDIYPKEATIDLRVIYLNSIYELSMMLLKKDIIRFEPFLTRLEKINKEDSISIYELLLTQSLLKNDINTICSVTYSLAKNSTSNGVNINNNNYPTNSIQNGIANQYTQLEIFTLLKTLLKSIELLSHSMSGFLIKFLISNFKSDKLILALSMFNIENVVSSVRENQDLICNIDYQNKIIDGTFHFNSETFDYSCSRLKFLLLGQQLYINRMNLQPNNNPVEFVNLAVNESYCEHLFEGIKNNKEKYGLEFLNDNSFLQRYKEILLQSL